MVVLNWVVLFAAAVVVAVVVFVLVFCVVLFQQVFLCFLKPYRPFWGATFLPEVKAGLFEGCSKCCSKCHLSVLPEKVACLGFGVRFLVRVLQNPIVIPLSSCGSGAGVQAMSSQTEEAWGHM